MKTCTRKKPQGQLIENVQELCRLCLCKAEQLVPIITEDTNNGCAELVSRIMICVGLKIKREDFLPNIICTECLKTVDNIYAFRKRCEVSNKKLKSHVVAMKEKQMELELQRQNEIANHKFEKNQLPQANSDVDNVILLSVKTEPIELEVEPMDVVTAPANNINSVKPRKSCRVKKKEIVQEVRQTDIKQVPSRVQRSSTLSTTEAEYIHQAGTSSVHIKVELADDPLCSSQAGTVAESEALGLRSTYDIPLDIVKVELEDEDVGPSIAQRSRLNTHKHHEDITSAYLKTSGNTQEITRIPKNETNLTDEDNTFVGTNIVEAYHEARTQIHKYIDDNKTIGHNSAKVKCRNKTIKQRRVRNDTHKQLICDICKKRYMNKASLVCHLRTHTVEKPYECNVCKKVFKLKKYLNKHIRTHTGEKPFQCTICKKCFTEKSSLGHHMRTHTGEKPFQCTVCMKRFCHVSTLNKHIILHTDEKPFECVICGERFRYKITLEGHMITHTGKKPFECNVCKERFSHKASLDNHIPIHAAVKPFECVVCKKGFIKKFQLDIHFRTHTGEKPFECNVCEKRFGLKSSLRHHMRTHIGENPFKCPVCKARFSQKSALDSHIPIHDVDKPFECSVCKMRFIKQSRLDIHFRTHTGEKPFECDVCQKRFRGKLHLVRHILTHGEKSLECNVCKKYFSHKFLLDCHMRIHTRGGVCQSAV